MPLDQARKFREDVRELEKFLRSTDKDSKTYGCPGVLMHGDRVFDPQWFVDMGYRNVTMFVQRPGDYILTHPMCAHFVWNLGPNFKEVVSLPSPGWVPFGVLCVDCNAP
jgi:hypothetical protein